MKNVIRSLVVMMVVFGLMVMGCPTEDENKNSPPGEGKVVAEEYRGVYKTETFSSSAFFKITLTENSFDHRRIKINPDGSETLDTTWQVYTRTPVWTVGDKLYDVVEGVENHMSYVTLSTSTIRYDQRTYTKVNNP